MDTKETGLIKVKENIFTKFFNKLKNIFFKRKNIKLNENSKIERNPLEEKLEFLQKEYDDLKAELNSKYAELEYIKLKDYKIALEIYTIEEQDLLEIIKLKTNKLKRLVVEYDLLIEQRRNYG